MFLRTRNLALNTRHSRERRGYVLIAVLIVIVVLSLLAYRFTDAMTSEYRAGVRTADMAQARAAAASGIYYTAAMLADPTTRASLGDVTNNPGVFQDILVRQSPDRESRFSVISVAMISTGNYQQQYGVIDESGKLNINALIALDKTGEVLANALSKLPPLMNRPDIVDAIVDWVDADDNPRANGAESADYQSLANPYNAKNGPLNSIDELLLVKNMTPQILYGTDRNRNGVNDDGGGALDRGLIDYITVNSREVNVDSTGVLRIWINGDDMNGIYTALQSAVGNDMAAYIIGAKLFGTQQLDANGNPVQKLQVTVSGGGTGGGKGGKGGGGTIIIGGGGKGGGGNQQKVRTGTMDELIAAVESKLQSASSSGKTVNSVMDLMNTRITLPKQSGGGGGGGGGGGKGGQQETVVVNSPLNDPSQLSELLPLLLDKTSTKEAVEMVPRLNVNTAPREVLQGLPGLTDADVDMILGARDGLAPDDPATTTGAWLVTAANLDPAKFKALQNYVTGTTMVYRVEAIGYLTGGGPMARVEAIIDTNLGTPRILYYREITDLDNPRAFQPQQQQGQ